MRAPRSPSGVTLIELMVALAVSSAVMVGIVATVGSQQKAYYNGQQLRAAQGSARAALLVMQQQLRMAGFGMDPALALDFSWYGVPGGSAWAPGAEGALAGGLCPAEMNGCPRDAAANADEIVFYSRNPNYYINPNTGALTGRVWSVAVAPTATSVTLNVRVGQRFAKGQILLLLCPPVPNNYVYFTVDQSVTAGSPTQALTLKPAAANDPFRRQDLAAGNACYAAGRVFQIDRFRYHIRPVAVNAGPPIQYDPYLVLDMGIDIDTSNDQVVDQNDELLVAEGIELLQFAYTFSATGLGTAGDGVSGAPGNAITFTSENLAATPQNFGNLTLNTVYTTQFPGPPPTQAPNLYFSSSWYPYSSAAPARLVNNQANIRSVRIAMVARSPEADLSAKTARRIDTNFTLLDMAGTSSAPAWIRQNATRGALGEDGYQRWILDATVPLPNMDARAMLAN